MKKLVIAIIFYVCLVVIFVPTIVTMIFSFKDLPDKPKAEGEAIEVFNPEIDVKSLDLFEEYIKGVVAAEMPMSFNEEALKAQAVAARTYAVRKMKELKSTEVPYEIGQAYLSDEELKKKWGENFATYEARARKVVSETKGEIMIYENEPILAVFHAQSAGKTENAENVWENEVPYLKSVDSSLDENAPDFETEMIFSNKDLMDRLTLEFGELELDENDIMKQIKITERSKADYVQKIQIGTGIFTGADVRMALGLRSANFIIKKKDKNSVSFITKGYGHGAGMSQYGASFMANEGNDYHEILGHYYKGVEFEVLK